MTVLGPDRREGYVELGVVPGYDGWAATYDADPNPLIALEQAITLDVIGDVRGQRALDLGCGTGRYCLLLAARGAEVLGLDPSEEMLARAKSRLSGTQGVTLRQGTIESAGLPARHFDLVLSALVLGHLSDLAPVFQHVSRILKPGGRMVLSDIHPFWPVSGHDYTEFFDEEGQEFRIPVYTHLLEEYWSLAHETGLRLEAIREPRIDGSLIEQFPLLEDYRQVPLAIVLRLDKRVVAA